MSDKELKQSMKALKAVHTSHKKSPEKAREFLVKAGIATKAGKLTKRYAQGA